MPWRFTTSYPDYFLQLSRLLRDPVYRTPSVPNGTGKPILLIPGFLAGDWTLRVMAGWLNRLGYRAYFSGIDWNIDCPNRTGHLLRWRLDHIIRETGHRIVVVGHSLGGMLARFLGTNFPDKIQHVVTLGSPIQPAPHVNPLIWLTSRVLHPFRQWRGQLPPECGSPDCNCHFTQSVFASVPQEVGFTAIFSKQDEVVDWHASLDPERDAQEVSGRHIGLIVNPQVYRILAEVLTAYSQNPNDDGLKASAQPRSDRSEA